MSEHEGRAHGIEATGPDDVRRERTGPRVPVAMDAAAFRAVGHRLVDDVAALLESVPSRRVAPGLSPERVRGILDAEAPLPEEGTAAGPLLERAVALLADHSLYNGHPRFFGYITSSPTPIGALADLLAAAINPNVGGWSLSPMATEIEAQTVRWIAELIGYPVDAGGLLVSGGNVANFVGFFAARAAAGREWGIRRSGASGDGSRPFRVYVSGETHTWIEKAADLGGLGTEAVRWIATDAALRMDPEALRRAVERDREEGLLPMMVVGTGGSVSTGAVDPLPELAAYCREEEIWFHVDGAYGGFAVAAPEAPGDLRGLAEADSVAVDPHKWLYAPLEAGCALVRRTDALRDAFAYHPPYYYFGVEATNYVDLGPQNSRGFRALKVWLALQQAGRSGYGRMISDDIRLSRRLHEAVERHPELEAMVQGLSISTFRVVPPELREGVGTGAVDDYLDELNREVQDRLERGGEAFVSNAVIRGRYALRACIVNFNTTAEDVDALPEIVVRTGRAAHAELGGPGS